MGFMRVACWIVVHTVDFAAPRSSFPSLVMAAAASSKALGSWRCLSAHAPADQLTSAPGCSASSPRLLGRSSNASGIVGHTLLVFGGENTPRVPIDDCVHRFDLQGKNGWSAVRKPDGVPASQWPQARIGHSGAVVSDKFYIYGGRSAFEADETFSDLWCFDPASGSFTLVDQKGSKPPPLSYQAMVAAQDGHSFLLFGGCRIDHARTNGLWRFDVATATWTELSAHASPAVGAPSGRGGPALAATVEAAYVAFGYNGKEEQSDLWRFDFASAKWSELTSSVSGSAPKARSVTDLVVLGSSPVSDASVGASLWMFGGEFTPSAQGHEGAGEYHRDAFQFDIARKHWSECESTSDASEAPVARGWFNSLRYDAHRVVVFGGFDGVQRRNDVYLWTAAGGK